MKIHLLVCDWFEGLLPDSVPSIPSLFCDLFNSVKENLTYEFYNVPERELPISINQNDLYLITGSRTGAYENLPWIKELMNFICRAAEANARLTGICFGHQLIAQALGGKVEPAVQGWGAGARVSGIVNPKGEKYFPDKNLCLYYNHNDQVFLLPPQAERVATSDFCMNEVFCIGDRILTFQGHPEYTKEYMTHVIEIANHAEENEKIMALQSLENETVQKREFAKWILDI